MLLFITACKNNETKPNQSAKVVANSEIYNQRHADVRYKALNNNKIEISRIIFKGFSSDVQADFWKFKLESWRDNVNTPDVEKVAINNLLPKITGELFSVDETNQVYLDFIKYIEVDWLPTIQPYINYERLMLLIASPYYPETPTGIIIVGGDQGGGTDCECNLSSSSDFCNGVPGAGSGAGGAHCVRSKGCNGSAHGCGWGWVMTCRGMCK